MVLGILAAIQTDLFDAEHQAKQLGGCKICLMIVGGAKLLRSLPAAGYTAYAPLFHWLHAKQTSHEDRTLTCWPPTQHVQHELNCSAQTTSVHNVEGIVSVMKTAWCVIMPKVFNQRTWWTGSASIKCCRVGKLPTSLRLQHFEANRGGLLCSNALCCWSLLFRPCAGETTFYQVRFGGVHCA